MSDVFISYKREEKAHAERVARALNARGYKLWWDADMIPGDEYRQRTLAALKSCKAALVLWSPASMLSSWVLDEAERAKKRGVLVPVMIISVDDLPLAFGQLHTHTLVGWDGSPDHPLFAPVLRAVERLVGAPAKRATRAKAKAKDGDADLTFWLGIAESRNATDFETYLARFPEGTFADLARSRLEALQKKAFDQAAFTRQLDEAGRKASSGVRGFMSGASARVRAFAQARPSPNPMAQSSARAMLRRSELGFIALVALLAPFPIWPLVNVLYDADYVFWGPDFQNLFDPSYAVNLYWAAPVLTLGAWLYDQLEALVAKAPTRFAVPGLRVLVGVALFAAIAAGLSEADYDDGVAAHFAFWTASVWLAALAARVVGPRLRRIFVN